MNALVLYDSTYGNTEKLARAVGAAVGGGTKVVRIAEADTAELGQAELLIMASPTTGGRPTGAMLRVLSGLPAGSLKGVKVAAIDTRLKAKWVRIFGYAAEKMAATLAEAGGTPIAPPEGFFVVGAKGPLAEGELERAAAWAKRIV